MKSWPNALRFSKKKTSTESCYLLQKLANVAQRNTLPAAKLDLLAEAAAAFIGAEQYGEAGPLLVRLKQWDRAAEVLFAGRQHEGALQACLDGRRPDKLVDLIVLAPTLPPQSTFGNKLLVMRTAKVLSTSCTLVLEGPITFKQQIQFTAHFTQFAIIHTASE